MYAVVGRLAFCRPGRPLAIRDGAEGAGWTEHPVSAGVFGLIQPLVCTAEDLLEVSPSAGQLATPTLRVKCRGAPPAGRGTSGEFDPKLICTAVSPFNVHPRKGNDELLSAVPGHEIARAHGLPATGQRATAARDRRPGARSVVETFELIHVEQRNAQSCTTGVGASEFLLEPLEERTPLGEPRQVVGAHHEAQMAGPVGDRDATHRYCPKDKDPQGVRDRREAPMGRALEVLEVPVARDPAVRPRNSPSARSPANAEMRQS